MTKLVHGLYFRPEKHKIDHRTRLGRALKMIAQALLDQFPSPAPVAAQLLAQRAAYKLVRAASYEAWVLEKSQAQAPALDSDMDYLKLTASIRADLQTLYAMARPGAQEKETPNLEAYLKALKEGAIPVEGSHTK
jgi:hypothetical protein